jgi:hypothetical protein
MKNVEVRKDGVVVVQDRLRKNKCRRGMAKIRNVNRLTSKYFLMLYKQLDLQHSKFKIFDTPKIC